MNSVKASRCTRTSSSASWAMAPAARAPSRSSSSGSKCRRPAASRLPARMRAIREFAEHRRAHVQMVFQDPQSALNPRRRVASIVTQPMEAAGVSHMGGAAGEGRAAAERDRSAARSRDALPDATVRRAAPAREHRPRAVRRAAHPDCGRDRVRPRCVGAGASCSICCPRCGGIATSRCCSSRTTFRWCVISATACW